MIPIIHRLHCSTVMFTALWATVLVGLQLLKQTDAPALVQDGLCSHQLHTCKMQVSLEPKDVADLLR